MIRDILSSLNNYPNLPSNYTGIATIKKWVDLFSTKKAADELDENDLR
jgi:hypothetical protein